MKTTVKSEIQQVSQVYRGHNIPENTLARWISDVDGYISKDILLISENLPDYMYSEGFTGDISVFSANTLSGSFPHVSRSCRMEGTITYDNGETQSLNAQILSADDSLVTFESEIFATHLGASGKLRGSFIGYDAELLVSDAPYRRMYFLYLSAMIDFVNKQFNLYSNELTEYNSTVSDYRHYIVTRYNPASTAKGMLPNYYISPYALAVKHGYKGTEAEWITTVAGRDGVGIASIEQTVSSTEDNGENVITVSLTNGEKTEFVVRNGSQGDTDAVRIKDSDTDSTYMTIHYAGDELENADWVAAWNPDDPTQIKAIAPSKLLKNSLLDFLHPIGSIYTSVVDTDPTALFGGTWERIKDTFLLTAGDTYVAGTTGGEAKHTLTLDEIPYHYHAEFFYAEGVGELTVPGGTARIPGETGFLFSTSETPNASRGVLGDTSGVGGNQPHNNMPPYLTVYAWKRIA